MWVDTCISYSPNRVVYLRMIVYVRICLCTYIRVYICTYYVRVYDIVYVSVSVCVNRDSAGVFQHV